MVESIIGKSLLVQREFFATGQTKDPNYRIATLRKLKALIKKNEKAITDALEEDLHKSQFESFITEIRPVYQEIDWHIRNLKKLSKTQSVLTPALMRPSRSYILREPYGVVLIVAPWNYPFNLAFIPLIGALAAGNCVILKTANYSAATTELIKRIINMNFREHYIRAFGGGREVNRLLMQERFDYLFFTGSPELGKTFAQSAAKNLTPCTLELGGKSPCIVDADADLQSAARRIVWGKFLNAGQTCIAPDYLLVQQDIKDALLTKISAEIERQFAPHPAESPDYGRIINRNAFMRIREYLKDGKIVCGGQVRVSDRYISPTLLDEVSPDAPLMQDEIFGPILPVLTFENFEELLSFLSAREKPLALYYFTKDLSTAKKRIAFMDSGGLCINDVLLHYANPRLPFGGVGNSGMGRYHGKYSFETFSRERACVISPTARDIPFRYAPHKNKFRILKKIF